MTPPQLLSFINQFSRVTDSEVRRYCQAQGVQFARDVSPIWGICPGVEFAASGTHTEGASPAWLTDTLDVDGALGYHDEDKDGVVYIKVADIPGYDWRTTASHECLEVKGDSPANMWALGPDGQTMFAYELADPVEGDVYEVDGVPMSNFVFPAWFDPNAARGSRFDFMGKLSAPFTMTAGGYMIVWSISGQPTQQFGAFKHEIAPRVHIHYGPDVSESRRIGIENKYRRTGRRDPYKYKVKP